MLNPLGTSLGQVGLPYWRLEEQGLEIRNPAGCWVTGAVLQVQTDYPPAFLVPRGKLRLERLSLVCVPAARPSFG